MTIEMAWFGGTGITGTRYLTAQPGPAFCWSVFLATTRVHVAEYRDGIQPFSSASVSESMISFLYISNWHSFSDEYMCISTASSRCTSSSPFLWDGVGFHDLVFTTISKDPSSEKRGLWDPVVFYAWWPFLWPTKDICRLLTFHSLWPLIFRKIPFSSFFLLLLKADESLVFTIWYPKNPAEFWWHSCS